MRVLCLAVLIALVAGCSQRIGDFTVISTRNVNLDEDYEIIAYRVEGKDTKPYIIAFPTGFPSLEEAVDDALYRYRGDFLTDASLHYEYFVIPLIYGEFTYRVRGDVWKRVENE